MSDVMMKCGHAANSTSHGLPACAICAPDANAFTVANSAPDLIGREARCGCGAVRPSDPSLAFFEYRGEGTPSTRACAHCAYYERAHIRKDAGERHLLKVCDNYEPHGAYDHDLFYCGCKGWD